VVSILLLVKSVEQKTRSIRTSTSLKGQKCEPEHGHNKLRETGRTSSLSDVLPPNLQLSSKYCHHSPVCTNYGTNSDSGAVPRLRSWLPSTEPRVPAGLTPLQPCGSYYLWSLAFLRPQLIVPSSTVNLMAKRPNQLDVRPVSRSLLWPCSGSHIVRWWLLTFETGRRTYRPCFLFDRFNEEQYHSM
jgi:hypothetical protein